ncbi:hypothetical protein CEXT_401011 [Caerostris extrusa]|uniref:Uncharacterized protein n=1 Tax=Caerostris extrusa TaxID=172846 RepID=A0AAV4UWX2_CAEEX|nr:hypothetical protein CEXT_401011 [Caerostris extrusa]
MLQRRNKTSSVTFSSAEVFLSSPKSNFSSHPLSWEYLSSISATDVYWKSIDGKPRNISRRTISDFRHLFPLRNPSKSGESRKQSLHVPSWIQNATSDILRSGFRFPFLS